MADVLNKLEGDQIADRNNPIKTFQGMLDSRKSEFLKALPSHISFEKFQRTVMTAVIGDRDLLTADRESLLFACIKAASDGLLPDKREAAFVIFNSKIKRNGKDEWVKQAQYMPMYQGILKKVRQSGDVSSIAAHVVYEKDVFEYTLGDDEKIIHIPSHDPETGDVVAAYCIVKLKDGSIYREVMLKHEIERVRKSSKSGCVTESDLKYNSDLKIGDPKGIWKEWYGEMAKKTVFRRASKWLPQSIDFQSENEFQDHDSIGIVKDAPAIKDETVIDGVATEVSENEPAQLEKPDGQPDLSSIIQDKQKQQSLV